MCGGDLDQIEAGSVAKCRYCGSTQTIPRISDDRRTEIYDRADRFRRSGDFDRAAKLFEQLLEEDSSDSDIYWNIVLCRYGVDYVKDPMSGERIPTVNRMQDTSILADEDYRMALEHAGYEQKAVYEENARRINEIQKDIRAVSEKEEPFDVFICYKETDENGARTRDSAMATDLYYALEREGYKVFFARITLEDKLGKAYEPYIFAALNSAKVMVVMGTKPEYFNAPWVKNEWSRFIALVKKSHGTKALIPAYLNMDPYLLPEEFAHLQALDMSKIGFLQDLTRGIKKILDDGKTGPDIHDPSSGTYNPGSVTPLITRARIFLENGEWDNANEYCEKTLDLDPVNTDAYLIKLLSQAKVKSVDRLSGSTVPLDSYSSYRMAVKYADKKVSAELVQINSEVSARIAEENERKRRLEAEREQIRREQARKKAELDNAQAEMTRLTQTYNDQNARKSSLESNIAYVRNELSQTGKIRSLAGWVIGTAVIAVVMMIASSAIGFTKSYLGSAPLGFFGGIAMIVHFVLTILLLIRRGKSGWLVLLDFVAYGLFGLIFAISTLSKTQKSKLVQQENDLTRQHTELLSQMEQTAKAYNDINRNIELMKQQL